MLARLAHLANCLLFVRGGYVPSRHEKRDIGIGFFVFGMVLFLLTRNVTMPLFMAVLPAAFFFSAAQKNEKDIVDAAQRTRMIEEGAEEEEEDDDDDGAEEEEENV